MKEKIESATSETILQIPIDIKIGKKTYKVAKPTAATVIFISKYISKLPIVDIDKSVNPLHYALSLASDNDYSNEILSILIIGAKKLNKSPFSFFYKLQQKRLSKKILYELDHEEIFKHTVSILNHIKSAFFLSTIIFLNEINLIKKTKN